MGQSPDSRLSYLVNQPVGQSPDSRVSYSINQRAINHSVSWSVPRQYSQLVSQSTSHKSFSQLVSLQTVESVNKKLLNEPAINHSVSWSVPWQLSHLISQSTSYTVSYTVVSQSTSNKSFSQWVSLQTVDSVTWSINQLVSPLTVESVIQSINEP